MRLWLLTLTEMGLWRFKKSATSSLSKVCKIDEISTNFYSKPSKSHPFRPFFENFVKNFIDFVDFKIFTRYWKWAAGLVSGCRGQRPVRPGWLHGIHRRDIAAQRLHSRRFMLARLLRIWYKFTWNDFSKFCDRREHFFATKSWFFYDFDTKIMNIIQSFVIFFCANENEKFHRCANFFF